MSIGMLLFYAVASIAAVIAVYYSRKVGMCYDAEPPRAPAASDVTAEDVLRQFGVRARTTAVPKCIDKVDHHLRQMIMEYDRLTFDGLTNIYDRRMVFESPSDERVVQIGTTAEGSRVFVQCDVTDPRVYVEDVDDCLPGELRVFAANILEYVLLSYHEHLDAAKRVRVPHAG
ncbi:hypothetical protein RAS1_14840 [Phycisphaerae bacterium RAS1]|nr:hypothetical protein RAS1_14840 [Phycisphaerae bacterium RAS1]